MVNYMVPKKHEVRELMTGSFKVKNVHCKQCLQTVGWKYLEASCESQKYKEDCFVIEASLISKLKTGDSLISYLNSKPDDKTVGRGKKRDLDTTLVYEDGTHYFEMQKDLLAHYGYSCFKYFFGHNEDDEDDYENLAGPFYFSYRDRRGYVFDDDKEVKEEDSDESPTEDSSDASVRFDTHSYYLLQANSRRYLPRFTSVLTVGSTDQGVNEEDRARLNGYTDVQ